VVVVTTDKDLAQLVREDGRLRLFDFAKAKTLDAAGVRERFGVSPAQIPDYLALVGDAVDKLPGVPGIGPRTAAQLLVRFGRIEEIPTSPDAWREAGIRGADALAARFAASREQAFTVRSLATLRHDVPGMAPSIDALTWHGPDRAHAAELCARLGWQGLARRIDALVAKNAPKGEASG
jgi:5'-3' exonuclease